MKAPVIALGLGVLGLVAFAVYRARTSTGSADSTDNTDTTDGLSDWSSTDTTGEPVQDTGFIEDTMNRISNFVSGNDIASVVEAGPGYIVVTRPDGTTVKLKGSRNWRNNNPGNLEYGGFAIGMGAVGTDGRFAVFPTYDAGRRAKEALIFEGKNYAGLSLSAAINRYAPPVENNTGWYQNTVLASVGGVDKPMSDYSASERQSIMDAMEKVEGFKPGSVTVVG
jgi:hypothetical protein